MKNMTLVKKYLPQNPDIEVFVPNYKEPILPVNHGGFGWYGLVAYNEQGQLMCHECGVFRDDLTKHVIVHGLTSRAYKLKYGLLLRNHLSSQSLHKKRSISYSNRADINELREKFLIAKPWKHKANRNPSMSLELQNKHDTCTKQVLRVLANTVDLYGPEIKANQINSGLLELIYKRFGSFNKAKQILQLTINKEGKYAKQIILENMCCFHSQNGHWPVYGDYIANRMICSISPIHRYGGIKALRQEAMKLREEQEARRIRGEQVAQYANKIEMELAGTARR